jgi:DNA-binding transcriptional ArsR family regulator
MSVDSFPRQATVGGMETVLWQALAGTRGGPNRARILRALDERPRNANQLAEDLELAYNTVRHHLEVLERNGIVTSSDATYGTVYLPSERARSHWGTVEEILSQVDDT